MKITWEDRKNAGKIDDYTITDKPLLSFEYAWFLVTDTTAQYVESHEYGVWNKDMSATQKQEVIEFYNSYPRDPQSKPPFDEATQKLAENGTEVVDGLTYKKYVVVAKTTDEIAEYQVQLQLQARDAMVRSIEELIQSKIDSYNEANGVLFKDIDACAKYVNIPSYTHYQFCIDVIQWQTNVWEAARQIQADVLAGTRAMPTVEELMVELPVFGT